MGGYLFFGSIVGSNSHYICPPPPLHSRKSVRQ